MSSSPTASLIIIGNEILSGRTQDKNLAFLAGQLTELGIRLQEVRVIPDIPEKIIVTVNELRALHSYVFTSGGIGPTHDDITSQCVADAFGVPLICHPEAFAQLKQRYAEGEFNEARQKMAHVPMGAALIPNPISTAPGFRIENVYVMAGVPNIMQAMFDNIRHELQGGKPIESREIAVFMPEGAIAKPLTDLQARYPDVDMGSYPFVRESRLGTSLVLRSNDAGRLAVAYAALEEMLDGMKAERG